MLNLLSVRRHAIGAANTIRLAIASSSPGRRKETTGYEVKYDGHPVAQSDGRGG
jgi:hypothetical protein